MLGYRDGKAQNLRPNKHVHAREFFLIGREKARPIFAYADRRPDGLAGVDEKLDFPFASDREVDLIERSGTELT